MFLGSFSLQGGSRGYFDFIGVFLCFVSFLQPSAPPPTLALLTPFPWPHTTFFCTSLAVHSSFQVVCISFLCTLWLPGTYTWELSPKHMSEGILISGWTFRNHMGWLKGPAFPHEPVQEALHKVVRIIQQLCRYLDDCSGEVRGR